MIDGIHTSFFLEILNGGAVTPELIWLVLLGDYLCRESRRRRLRFYDWLKLPPSMNLIVAIFIFDFASIVRSITVWEWRKFDGGMTPFGPIQMMILLGCGTGAVVGTLCKIRAITYPDWGNGPWLAATAISALMLASLIFL